MNIPEIRTQITHLFKTWKGEEPKELKELPLSGSNRKYFRVLLAEKTFIATYNVDKDENAAFFYLANQLNSAGVNVPEVYYKNEELGIYFQEDLGNDNLFDVITAAQHKSEEEVLAAYRIVVDEMPKLQYEAAQGMDFSICYPREAFDRQSIQWDLNYFKYCFLKLVDLPFSEQKLEDEYQKLIDFLLEAPSDFFLFRDFQSRNIMLKNEQVYFIDFQGGRRGALQYDLASLLYESKTNLNDNLRNKILDYYVEVFSKHEFFDKAIFLKYYPAFSFIRVLQAFGAYGYRGLFEKKAFFVNSILKGLKNLESITKDKLLQHEFPYLCSLVNTMQQLESRFTVPESEGKLTVHITSFSYKKGYPEDWSGNGGGFVFDCRALPNPGRYEEYRASTGRDENVIAFLEKELEVKEFVDNAFDTVDKSVQKYIERGFTNLSVSFGCTGGQHRSVYSAEQLFSHLKMNFDVNIRLTHREQNMEEFYGKDHVQKDL